MKNLLTTIATTAVMLLPLLSDAQTISSIPFSDGEKMTLVLHYRCGFSADIGEVVATTSCNGTDNDRNYHISVSACTYPFYDNFFRVRDVYEAWFDSRMNPAKFHKKVSEGKYTADCTHTWKGDGTCDLSMRKSSRPPLDTTMAFGTEVSDVVNVIYYMRSLDIGYVKNNTIYRTACSDRTLYDLRIRYRGTEEKKIKGLGTFRCNRIGVSITKRADTVDDSGTNDISINTDVFKGDDDVIVWFSDDDASAPMFFTFPIRVGSINGRLQSIEGSAALTSKISD